MKIDVGMEDVDIEVTVEAVENDDKLQYVC